RSRNLHWVGCPRHNARRTHVEPNLTRLARFRSSGTMKGETMESALTGNSACQKTMRCGIYCRVSDKKHVEQGFGYDYQLRELPADAERMGWEVAEIYQEPGISGGAIDTRPAILRLLGDMAKGRFDVILAVESSRFSRGGPADMSIVMAACDRSGVSLY